MIEQQIKKMFEDRKKIAESIENLVSLGFYDKIIQKIGLEEKFLLQIFNLIDKRQQNLNRYTFILDRQYFDQIFLTRYPQ